jgi:hypothetical protein
MGAARGVRLHEDGVKLFVAALKAGDDREVVPVLSVGLDLHKKYSEIEVLEESGERQPLG